MRWIVVVLIPVRSGHPAGAPVGRPVGRRLEGERDHPVALGPAIRRGASRARGIARPARRSRAKRPRHRRPSSCGRRARRRSARWRPRRPRPGSPGPASLGAVRSCPPAPELGAPPVPSRRSPAEAAGWFGMRSIVAATRRTV